MAKNGLKVVKKEQQSPGETEGGLELPVTKKSRRKPSGTKKDPKKVSPRTRVRNAQLKVLDQVDNILKGNCGSAKKGNYNCAKFVLDWSGISDLRSPLAKPLQQKSVASALLKKLKQAAEKQQRAKDSPDVK